MIAHLKIIKSWPLVTSDNQILTLGIHDFRWDLIAGRIPGRNAEEIERFWIMRHWEWEGLADRRKLHKKENSKIFDH